MKTFRNWDVDQNWLLPPSLGEFVPADHVAHFIRDLVRNELDIPAVPPGHDGRRALVCVYAERLFLATHLTVLRGASGLYGSDGFEQSRLSYH